MDYERKTTMSELLHDIKELIALGECPCKSAALKHWDETLARAADHIEAQAARIAELEAERDELRASIIAYQHMHDHLGSGDIETGRAWDRMRRVVNMGIRKERAEAVRKGGG